MTEPNTLEVPVCVRDGEPVATITVAGVEFRMGIGELQTVLGCAQMDIKNASGPAQRCVGQFLGIAIEVCGMACSLSPKPEEADMDVNLQRWEATGVGGVCDLDAITGRLAELRQAVKVDWANEREKFADRGHRLFVADSQAVTATWLL